MDFIVGVEIKLSGNHTSLGADGKPHLLYDICDELQGKYPKDFKFVGWHPHCRCFATPIFKTDQEMEADEEAILNDQAPSAPNTSENSVTDTPDNFKAWTEANQERMERAKQLPYFIKDNKRYFGSLFPDHAEPAPAEPEPLTILQRAALRHAARTPEQIQSIQQAWEERDANSPLKPIIKIIDEDFLIRYKEVKRHIQPLTEEDIISRLGGGDKTGGSCSSLAFAYAGNRHGFDVLDFRGGESREFFANHAIIKSITLRVGGIVEVGNSDFAATTKIFAHIKSGKEYYFTTGGHAAIIRKTEKGDYQYLELQDSKSNGWKDLSYERLKNRFGAKTSKELGKFAAESMLIDIELLKRDKGFRELLGYINTADRWQMKGIKGTTK